MLNMSIGNIFNKFIINIVIVIIIGDRLAAEVQW